MLNWRNDKTPEQAAASPSPRATQPAPARPHVGSPRLGELLVREGVITESQLGAALQTQRTSGAFLGQILVDLGYLGQTSLVLFLVKQCKIPHISLLDYEMAEELFQYVPKDLCKQYRLLPIDRLGRILTIAMVDPLDVEALEQVRGHCPDLKIKPILCDWNHYDTVARRLFHTGAREATEVTAASFGLAAKAQAKPAPQAAPPPAAPAKPEVAAAVDAAVDALIHQAAAAPPAPTPSSEPRKQPVQPASPAARPGLPVAGADPGAIAHAMRDALQEAVGTVLREQQQQFLASMAAVEAKRGASAIDPGMLAERLQVSLADAVSGAIGALAREQQKFLASLAATEQARAATQPNLNQWAEGLHVSMKSALREALAPMAALQSSQLREEATRLARNERVAGPASDTDSRSTIEAFPGSKFTPFPGGRNEENTPDLGAPEALDTPGLGVEADERVRTALDSDMLLSGYTFDEFLAGPVNSFTVTVARAVAERPGTEFSPLFLFGDVGTGKTHLVNAIGNEILMRNRDLRIGYVSASHFAGSHADALRNGTLDSFRESYCHWDVLILDDIQFLAGRPQAQEELFHIFSALCHERRQVVLTGDRAPAQVTGLEPRLASRFASGIVARLKPHEMEVRLAILKKHARRQRVAVPEEILSLIATRIPSDVRKMTGALRKVIAYAKLVGQDVSRELADEILSHLGTGEAA